MTVRRMLVLAGLAVVLFPSIGVAAPRSFNVVGVYDGTASPANSVNKSATSDPNDVATFTVDVLAAYNAGLGGVIDFEGFSGNPDGFRGVFDDGAKWVDFMVAGNTMQSVGANGTCYPISGVYGTTHTAPDTSGWEFTVGSVVNSAGGPSTWDYVNQVGLTVLSRAHGTYPLNVRATATYSDHSTESVTAFIDDGRGADDTFFGFTAPAGRTIDSVRLESLHKDTGNPVNTRIAIDDLGFITKPVRPGVLNLVPGANAGYSLRRLDNDYLGPAIEVRRASDGAAMDIGFDSDGRLDTAALTAFVGPGDNGYVATWYDQAGSRNLVQGTEGLQPQIVADGSIVADPVTGLPALEFSSSVLNYTGSGIASETMSVFAAASWFPWREPSESEATDHVARRLWSMQAGGATHSAVGGQDGRFAVGYRFGNAPRTSLTDESIEGDQPFVTSYVRNATPDDTDRIDWYLDGDLSWSWTGNLDTQGANALHVGAHWHSGGERRFFEGLVQEMLVYDSVLSHSDRARVHSNMMGLYIPEPSSALLLLCGMMFAVACRRRRNPSR